MKKLLHSKALLVSVALTFCLTSFSQTNVWKGRLIHGYVDDINEYSFATKTDKTILKKGTQPFIAKSGELFYINDAFPKARYLVRKSTAAGQFRDVLDMSNENPDYKKELEEYSVIRGTGISAILSSLSDPEISPDGRYLALTIYGYNGQAFKKNCVAVFDIATRKLVTKFDEKYGGTWAPDGRLVMTGWHNNESTGTTLYKGTPGIYVTDPGLTTATRIDKELDDPAPYHASVSPDGKKVAFIMNYHVWVMNMDGTGLKQLTDVDRDNIESYPTWSPDNKYIACWVYKTFERSYYTAIAVVPANAPKPVVLSDKAPVWPKDTKGFRISGGSGQFSWK